MARDPATHSWRTATSCLAASGTAAAKAGPPARVVGLQPTTWTPPETMAGSALLPTPRQTTRPWPPLGESRLSNDTATAWWTPGPRQTTTSRSSVAFLASTARTAACASRIEPATRPAPTAVVAPAPAALTWKWQPAVDTADTADTAVDSSNRVGILAIY